MQNDFVDKVLGKSKTGIAKDLMDKATAALGGPDVSEMPEHGLRDTHIRHHKDGSHTVNHIPYSGGEETSYAVKDAGELTKKLKQYLGPKKAGKAAEESAEGGTGSPAEEKSEGEQAY